MNKENQPQKSVADFLYSFAEDGEERKLKFYGIELLFAQSFPSLTSISTVEPGSGRIKINAFESMANKAWKYFNV